MNFVLTGLLCYNLEVLTSKRDRIHKKYSDKWIDVNVGICLGSKQDNFHYYK